MNRSPSRPPALDHRASEQQEGNNGQARADTEINRIRELNDALRKNCVGGRIMLTSGFNAYDSGFKTKALEAIKAFDAFYGRQRSSRRA